MEINYIAVLVAAVLQFIFGAIWYMPVFGKLWGQIHGFDKLPKETQDSMSKKMLPYLAVPFVSAIVTTVVFAILLKGFPNHWSIYGLAFHFWLGFVVPTQVGAVVFGGTEGRWVVTKILIMAGAALGCLLIAAATLDIMS